MRTREQLEKAIIDRYSVMAKRWDVPKKTAVDRAKALMGANTDAELREILSKPLNTLTINSLDPAHRAADKELAKAEREVSKIYRQATKEMQNGIDDYFEQFKKDDAKMRKKMADGDIDGDQYESWREDTIAHGQEWEDRLKVLSEDAAHTNEIARSAVRGHMPEIYAENINYGMYNIEKGVGMGTSFTLYDRRTVERLMVKNPELLPAPAKGSKTALSKDTKWNYRHIKNELLQGLLQGDSIDKISKRLKKVHGMNQRATIRYARTMTTGAENAGRNDAIKEAKDNGIDVEPQWMATLDGRTRDSHRALDGETRNAKTGKYSNGCRYPGDPQGAPGEVYNCRCTTIYKLKGFEKDFSDLSWRNSDNLEGTYEDWKKGKKAKAKTGNTSGVVQGKDISKTWKRRADKFDFEIEDVLNAQGFDGKPRLVNRAEFDKAVKAANGGKGFVAQRTYSAPDEETIKAYQDQLYGGKWYIDCSTGGAQYGQGMYCAADYTGKLSAGIKNEMHHYRDLGSTRKTLITDNEQVSKAVNVQWGRIKDKVTFPYNAGEGGILHNEKDVKKYLNGVIGKLDYKRIEELYGVSGHNRMAVQNSVNKIETLTLDPSARIITHRDAINMYNGVVPTEKLQEINKNVIEKSINKEFSDLNKTEMQFLRNNAGIDQMGWKEAHEIEKQIKTDRQQEIMSKFMNIEPDISARSKKEQQSVIDEYEKNRGKDKYDDLGSYIAARGYDAINAEGHGESGSYTVILNRTKCIFLKE